MIPVLMSRDDWVFYLEFAQLVSVCQAPFTTVADVSDRVSALFTLACAIPPMSGPSTGSPGPPRHPTPASIPQPTGNGCGRSWMPCPPDQRRALMTRLRTVMRSGSARSSCRYGGLQAATPWWVPVAHALSRRSVSDRPKRSTSPGSSRSWHSARQRIDDKGVEIVTQHREGTRRPR